MKEEKMTEADMAVHMYSVDAREWLYGILEDMGRARKLRSEQMKHIMDTFEKCHEAVDRKAFGADYRPVVLGGAE